MSLRNTKSLIPTLALCLAILGGLFAASAPRAAELGDPAGSLEGLDWVKGEPTRIPNAEQENAKPHVVEFWATWCPPCRDSIPHLTELQKKYKDKVVFVGVSSEDRETVAPFVEEQGETMDYRVAVDSEGKVSEAYMQAYGVNGIPHAFVVGADGRVLWHDHPMADLSSVLDAVLADEFDVEAMLKEKQEREAAMERLNENFQAYLAGLETAESPEEMRPVGENIIADGKYEPMAYTALASVILTNVPEHKQDLALARLAIEAAIAAGNGEDIELLFTQARLEAAAGHPEKAVELQQRCIEQAHEQGVGEEGLAMLTEELEELQAAAAKAEGTE